MSKWVLGRNDEKNTKIPTISRQITHFGYIGKMVEKLNHQISGILPATIMASYHALADKARLEKREIRAIDAISVICQFRDTPSKEAGWVVDDNQEIFNDVIQREINDHKGACLGMEDQWEDEITNLDHILEKIKGLEASFEKAKQSLGVLKKKAKKSKRVIQQIVETNVIEP